jgi:L-ascorbate metabolism protein UlaG (beta-lactamase superfamily)
MISVKTFGKKPSGEALQKIMRSPHYKNDSFKNLVPTVVMAEDASFVKTLWNFANKPADTVPPHPVPSVTTNLSVQPGTASVTWFGHSSYLLQIAGYNILVDPVFSGHASPFSFSVKNFAGTDSYHVDNMPFIDLLIITHDHYDHLDYETILLLRSKTGHICTSLGVGSHLRYWGIAAEKITELDWWEATTLAPANTIGNQQAPGIQLTATPARHFSGRGLVRGKTLWSSFVLQVGEQKIFLGGDSGYGDHFKKIGDTYGPFEMAILEAGQYNIRWPQIHMMPEETVQAAIDLKAGVLLPVHWAKFSLALHPWNEPVKRVQAAAKNKIKIATPKIGERFAISGPYPDTVWWD